MVKTQRCNPLSKTGCVTKERENRNFSKIYVWEEKEKYFQPSSSTGSRKLLEISVYKFLGDC